ncbi:MAG: ATP/GTP-binding protein [Candidatus Dormibacteraeota bacterium]|uniref:ATP/GTP-binding protein n=1 Tax=Candidatus Aeolococcus gillhamiae TaxID=3127015 RepID=A0A934N503_9BACT|nr:ATP/GTP-binding protein [Candidatus Dormibacteraeota bacterium]
MSAQAELTALIDRHRTGVGWSPLARAITLVENTPPWQLCIRDAPEPVHVIGVTGPPGAGKSTLVARLIESYSDSGRRVAVLAVDPSSATSGGAVLGDRIRMEASMNGRDDVFVRSLATRGAHGAVSMAVRNAVRILEGSGSFDTIIIETAGAGQTEIAVAGLADTVVLVTVPGLGDAVQAIKAGLMEVADLVVVNMADRPGAPETVRHLRFAMQRKLTVMQTVALRGAGVPELTDELNRRWRTLRATGELLVVREDKRLDEVAAVAEQWVRRCAVGGVGRRTGSLRSMVKEVLKEASAQWKA